MIFESVFDLFFKLLEGFFSMLPDVSWSVDTTAFQSFIGIIKVAMYLFPMQTVVTIISIVVWLTIFRILISIVKTIWDLLPFV